MQATTRTPQEWQAELTRRVRHRIFLEQNRCCAICDDVFLPDDEQAEIVIANQHRLAHQSCVTLDQLA